MTQLAPKFKEIILYIKKMVNIDISEYCTVSSKPRSFFNFDNSKLHYTKINEIKRLSHVYGKLKLSENGGYGYAIEVLK